MRVTDENNGGRPWARETELARWCYACGDLNPKGLHLEFEMDGEWAVTKFVAEQAHQGYPGYVHGGLVSTLLDEAMGWATFGRGIWALTGKMETRFRDIVPTNELLTVRARIEKDRGRALEVIGELRDNDGKLLADSKALMFKASGEQARLIEQAARGLGEKGL